MSGRLPLIDLTTLRAGEPGAVRETGRRIDEACRDVGFFRIAGHGVDPDLFERMDRLARELFTLPDADEAEARRCTGPTCSPPSRPTSPPPYWRGSTP